MTVPDEMLVLQFLVCHFKWLFQLPLLAVITIIRVKKELLVTLRTVFIKEKSEYLFLFGFIEDEKLLLGIANIFLLLYHGFWESFFKKMKKFWQIICLI